MTFTTETSRIRDRSSIELLTTMAAKQVLDRQIAHEAALTPIASVVRQLPTAAGFMEAQARADIDRNLATTVAGDFHGAYDVEHADAFLLSAYKDEGAEV